VAPGFSLDFPDLNSPPRLLNAFSYTCGFSVCAAASGFHTTSLDLSKKYLEWGKRNFALNDLDSSAHDFVFGDAFDWLSRWAKRGKSFELVILDPPTFSRSKKSGSFRADKDYGALAQSALKVLVPGGVLLASCNTETWAPEEFVATLGKAVADQGRRVLLSHYSPQPPDFPVSRGDPAYLKTLWLKIS
jgi:23S rRNA (cytosine1962-C5)-methyltransferase